MPALSSDLRGQLQKAVVAARDAAESAARAALTALAVNRAEPFPAMDGDQRRLRNALRAKVRQHGGGDAGLAALVEEVAYEQWHRMLFARFLAENGLLMHPNGVAVTLAECAELAPEEGEADEWQLAARYAGQMLPGIFRADDPAVRLRFAPEGQSKLERLLAELPPAVFTADDGLGWVYQFWQTKKKEEVNRSGRKIGGEDLPPVTQLFTEDYMVRFLLENSLGAWWVARHPSSPLLKDYEYLRYRDDGTPAAGTFPGWPERAADVTVMDPCCGSGHFLVAAFTMLRRMRMEEEGLGEVAAGDAVIRDNLFGLEIDPRCTQIAAFALALAAWKAGGYRALPLPNIACSGIPVEGQLDEWKRLAAGDVRLSMTLERLHGMFREAPVLGSLINPARVSLQSRLFEADFGQVAPVLSRALASEGPNGDPASTIFGVAAESTARAAKLLAGGYTLVATNVPYLALVRQDETLRRYCAEHFYEGRADLATAFLQRCWAFTSRDGSYALVTPQNWLFLGSYRALRKIALTQQSWNLVTRIGEHGFESSAAAGAFTALAIMTNRRPDATNRVVTLDASDMKTPAEKSALIRVSRMQHSFQMAQLQNPDYRILSEVAKSTELLEMFADAYAGIRTGDYSRFGRCLWELSAIENGWARQYSTVKDTCEYGGCEHILLWEDGKGQLAAYQSQVAERRYASGAWKQGGHAWRRRGVIVSQMRHLPCAIYTGELFDNNTAVIIPKTPGHLPAILAFCRSPEFHDEVRRIDPKMWVTNVTMVKVPFDLERWQKVADEAGPLPEPYSNDPTQWLFKGDPGDSTAPLQVAVARLLGYRWPEQGADALDDLAITGGIACLPAVAGEAPAAERLRALLAAAYGARWSVTEQERLVAEVGYAGKTLEDWLRDGFFSQHCALFHNRPFIWHVWDGAREGFAALVNYHKLDAATLDRLIYTYLGTWIETQRAQEKAGVAGANARMVAALALKQRLEAIREGEPPYDIYVRWKSLAAQPSGWDPDLNDGVRLNIRPFVTAGVLRAKFTVHWNKDRGANPDGSERLNDRHYTRAEKEAARREGGKI